MLDTFGRDINYLRLSVTDLCNYRCRYCMPQSGTVKQSHADILSFEEYLPIIEAAVSCGISKIRITGGEPLVRKGLSTLCAMTKNTAGVRELAITTNGSLLPQFAQELKDAGVDRLNISLDTLDPQKFAQMTRIGTLSDTLDGISAAKAAGFQNLKLNTVLIGGFNDDEIGDFVELTRDDDISVRFIELMPMHTCAEWPESCFLSADAVLAQYPELSPVGSSGAAELYQMPGYCGSDSPHEPGFLRPMLPHPHHRRRKTEALPALPGRNFTARTFR